jgi:hypothetical protein
MNERIKQLAEQAKKYALDAMIKITDKEQALKVYSETYDTKFAELIVKECMRMCEVTEMSFVTHGCDVEASGAITVKQFIAEHFGFEE